MSGTSLNDFTGDVDEQDEPSTSSRREGSPSSNSESSSSPSEDNGSSESSTVAVGGPTSDGLSEDAEDWLQQALESHDYAGVISVSTLSEVTSTDDQTTLCMSVEIRGNSRMFGSLGTCDPKEALNKTVERYLKRLSYPYHTERGRAIKAENLRIMATDAATEVWSDELDLDFERLSDSLTALEQHTDDEYVHQSKLLDSLSAASRANEADSVLAMQKRIDNTIRARLGYTKKYGSTVPEMDLKYADRTLEELAELLHKTRNWEETINDWRRHYQNQLREKRSTWVEEHLAELAAEFEPITPEKTLRR